MRLFGKVDNAIDRFDRATWLTGGPWGGFDMALTVPVFPILTNRIAQSPTTFGTNASARPLARSGSVDPANGSRNMTTPVGDH